MGNDGGSIPKRRELVKEAARNKTTTEIKESQQEQQEYHWTTCPLSHLPLALPIVSDYAGNLYNKDSILEFLLPAGDGTPGFSKSDNEEVLEGRVRSLRDVVEVKFTTADYDKEKGDTEDRKWACPMTNRALGPGVKAVYLVPCGHVFLESAVRELVGKECLLCNQPYEPDNVINILPTLSSEKERLAIRAEKLKEQGLTHSLKKIPGLGKKKRKNEHLSTADLSATTAHGKVATPPTIPTVDMHPPHVCMTKNPEALHKPIIRNPATASITAKVLAEEQAHAKRRKVEPNENLKSLFSSSNGSKQKKRDGDFMTRGFSIPAAGGRS